ncbi:RNA-binding protein 48-like [Gigantopelta aegis]|uniref:RNA-binding protein 48-like n=1 Tax=Gigantopelta aegis TaxID=1735272 RepID=UPI001B888B60|nr:RNA-binding protein 48-like [Gigantopelta aegis]
MYKRNWRMAAPMEAIPKHHQQDEVCSTRAPYREGRIPKAVKVYTVNHESHYVLVQGVPAVGASHELVKLFALYGAIDEYRILDDYPSEDFTEVYLICFKKIQSARFAKKKLDDYSFFGGVLHVCYAPEYETVEETRQKLQDRRKVIAAKTRQNASTTFTSSLEGAGNSGMMSSEVLSSVITRDTHFSTHGNQLHDKSVESSQIHSSNHFPGNSSKVPQSTSNFPSHTYFNSQKHGGAPLQREDNSLEINFRIPPPPLPGQNPSYFQSHKSKFEFAQVQSSHSTLPPNFDGRLPFHSNSKSKDFTSITDLNTQNSNKFSSPSSNNLNASKDRSITGPKISHSAEDKSLAKVPGNVNGGLVVRDYKKKGPVPRFVPRQAMTSKDKASKATESQGKQSADDELNKRIKSDAFKLGHVEGPTLPNSDALKAPLNIPAEQEQSVNQTVLDIRKRISKFISESTPNTKKTKTS